MVDQEEIHRKAASGEVKERREAVEQLRNNFVILPDKEQAWEDLHRLTHDTYLSVLEDAACALGSAFPHIPDKEQAWEDLHRLAHDEYGTVAVTHATHQPLRPVFQHFVLRGAACALGIAFPHIPDKKQAWEDLHRLAHDEDPVVRRGAARALGIAFPHIPDKKQAWEDLHRLAHDEDHVVRVSANHSFGRASIFRATEAESEDDFESELNNAIEFFERSSKESTHFNPSSFCLPFYRSFCTITFEKAEAKGEVQRYLAEAKSASKGSENKETLFEAVENLANALSEAHKATDFGAMKFDLNACRRYCDRAADLIGDAAEGAPGAAGILRRGLPIIGERIREIQEKAEALCRETRGTGTPYEPLGAEVNKWARDLSDRGYLQYEKDIPRIRDLLGKLCNLISEDERDYPCNIVEEIREEREPEDNLSDVVTALSYLVPSIKSEIQNVAKPTTDKTESHGQPSQKIGHSTTVFAGSGSTVVVPHTETESGDVTVNTAVTNEPQPKGHRKKIAIEISADIAVHVLVYTILHHFAEDLMPVIAPILVITALITLILIIRNAKS